MTRAVVLFSAGVDSAVHLRWAQRHFDSVRAVYFDAGQVYADREMQAALRLQERMGFSLDFLRVPTLREDFRTGAVEFRNLIFLALAAATGPAADAVVFGMLRGETPPDKNPRFVRRMQRLLRSQLGSSGYRDSRRVSIATPYALCTKAEMIADQLAWQPDDLDALLMTVACFSPKGECGTCWSCFNRWLAFKRNGIDLTDRYDVHPAEAMLDRVRELRDGGGGTQRRSMTIANAVSRLSWLTEVWAEMDAHLRRTRHVSALQWLRKRL